MMEVQKHYADANGNHFVASFFSQAEVDGYTPPPGATEIAPPPADGYVWQGDAWVPQPPAPPPPPPPTPEDKLAAAGLTVPELKALLGL